MYHPGPSPKGERHGREGRTPKADHRGLGRGAEFPIATPEALLAAFGGPDAPCRAGDVKLRAGDAGTVLTPADFPFASAEAVADTILSRAL
ncbi:MTH865 family protein [Deferrisoma palaeochoriense]